MWQHGEVLLHTLAKLLDVYSIMLTCRYAIKSAARGAMLLRCYAAEGARVSHHSGALCYYTK